jgi:dTDP-4-dehydrorhamnose reductase
MAAAESAAAAAARPPAVLVVGGTGYLGQFLIEDFLRRGWSVAYTHLSAPPLAAFPAAAAIRADVAAGADAPESLATALARLPELDAVVNCAALSSPAACERDLERAAAANLPAALVAALRALRAAGGGEPLLIHLSTDQVYSGERAWWEESDAPAPVNAYGRTKAAAEAALAAGWPRHVALRSSLIYGPEPPGAPVGRPLFVQFVDEALASGAPATFFADEWRCPVLVHDIVDACADLVARVDNSAALAALLGGAWNCGGPERLSRAEMALAVAAARGRDPALVVAAPAPSAAERGVASPADISMRSGKLEAALGRRLTPFAAGLKRAFPPQG